MKTVRRPGLCPGRRWGAYSVPQIPYVVRRGPLPLPRTLPRFRPSGLATPPQLSPTFTYPPTPLDATHQVPSSLNQKDHHMNHCYFYLYAVMHRTSR